MVTPLRGFLVPQSSASLAVEFMMLRPGRVALTLISVLVAGARLAAQGTDPATLKRLDALEATLHSLERRVGISQQS